MIEHAKEYNDGGYRSAAYSLSKAYKEGVGVEKDLEKAEYFKKTRPLE